MANLVKIMKLKKKKKEERNYGLSYEVVKKKNCQQGTIQLPSTHYSKICCKKFGLELSFFAAQAKKMMGD
jgi:hypothetical protein